MVPREEMVEMERSRTSAIDRVQAFITHTTGASYDGGPSGPARTLWQVLQATATRFPQAAAIDDGVRRLDYTDLMREVRSVASTLARAGIGAGDRVGIRLPSGTAQLYVSILAVLSAGAAYVPVDMDDPEARAETVFTEAGVCAVMTVDGPVMRIASRHHQPPHRPPVPDDDAWIIFTSGTTGVPKGVAVTHRSAAAFVDAESALFVTGDPLGPGNRVLAGMSVAFDASCEEMWLAWAHGACLVPAPRALMRTGPDLAAWLVERRIDVVSTVPTMAAMWPVEMLDGLRLLILGGEACQAGLADRLTARCPEVWNTYGPTEGTVVSSAARLQFGEPVRIGLPLAGWRLAVVDPDTGEQVSWGEVGELVIAGAGVARYLDCAQDARRFAPVPALGEGRAYRTGDLVRADPEGITYVGRADSQVKIRGYRIELTEIESVLLRMPGIAQAAVTTHERQPGVVELAAFYSAEDTGGDAPDRDAILEMLRERLPTHMVPAYLEQLSTIPLLVSGKTDRNNLPAPSLPRRLAARDGYAAPSTPVESVLAQELADVLGLDLVSADSHFFDVLGLSSLLVAHYCARIRALHRDDLPAVATRDVYLHPTVRELAAALTEAADSPSTVPVRRSAEPTGAGAGAGRSRARGVEYLMCGILQMLCFVGWLWITAEVLTADLRWLASAPGLTDLYLRSVVAGAGTLLLICGLPVIAKWVLIGRWKPQQIRVWSLAYVRFWVVKTLIKTNPLALTVGTPLYTMYLRALGARIGRGSLILTKDVPVCTDLFHVGDNTVIRQESRISCYRARAGMIETGPVGIGSGAFIGEHTVLDIGTSVGERAQLGHTSALWEGQHVPAGQTWHGSPAGPAQVDYRRVDSLPGGGPRRVVFGATQVLVAVLVTAPLMLAGSELFASTPVLSGLMEGGPNDLTGGWFYVDSIGWSAALFLGALLLGGALVFTLPPLLNRLVTPGRTYPVYGFHHGVLKAVRRMTNAKFYVELFGDSSYMVGYLHALGYRMPDVEQTGSNFGADLDHGTPFAVEIGRGTMVSDGASLINMDYSDSAVRVDPLTIGAHNFLGTAVAYPAGARTGANVLIATKAMVPIDGSVHENVGLLGSPCFEIPRTVTDDHRFDSLKTGDELASRIAAKNRHNLATMGIFLLVRWVEVAVVTLVGLIAAALYARTGVWVLVAVAAATLALPLTYGVLVERATMRFRSLKPQFCSIYHPYFWWHERYWKLLAAQLGLFDGTPLKGLAWRLVGVRVGRRLFDDGCGIPERTLVSIGDECTLGAGAVIQCHSMEDGTFKADHTVIGDGCTIGLGALIHYGVTMGDGSELLPDSFLMKGEAVPAGARWGGNPARPM